MKHAQRLDIIRLIKNTKGRFISLCAIVTLGVAFFIGISSVSTVMAHSVDKYDDENSLKDITVYSNYGFDEDDIQAINNLDDVLYAKGAQFVDVTANTSSFSFITRIHSYNQDNINEFVLVDGRMPKNESEALSESGTDLIQGFAIGDTVQLVRPKDDLNDYLTSDTLTIVGTIDTPVYLNQTKENSTLSNQFIRTYLYIPEKAFINDYYTEINVITKNGKEYDSFSDDYFDYDKSVKRKIEELAKTQQNSRRNKIYDEAMVEYEDGYKEYEDGLNTFNEEIADAKRKLSEAESEYNDGVKKLQDGINELNNAQKQMEDAQAEGVRKLNDAKVLYEKGLKDYEKGLDEYNTQKAQLEKTIEDIDKAIEELNTAKHALTILKQVKSIIDSNEFKQLIDSLDNLDDEIKNKPINELIDEINNYKDNIQNLLDTLGLSDMKTSEFIDLIEDGKQSSESDAAILSSQNTIRIIAYLNIQDDSSELVDTEVLGYEGYNDLLEVLKKYNRNTEITTVRDFLDAYQNTIIIHSLIQRMINDENAEVFIALLSTLDQDAPIIDNLDELVVVLEETVNTLNQSLPAEYQINTINDLINKYPLIVEYVDSQISDIEQSLISQGIDPNNIDQKIQELENTKQQINDGLKEGLTKLNEAKKQLDNASNEISNGEKTLLEELTKAQGLIDQGWQEIRDNQVLLRDARIELNNGYQELKENEADGLKELDDAKEELDKAWQDINDLSQGEWTVLDRSQHYASQTYRNTVNQMEAIANIFPLFFIFVAALVCLTTMTRLVNEERGQIGIMRALGYNRLQCASKYLIYALLATVIGIVLGCVIGIASFPMIIYNTWRMMYILPPMYIKIPWGRIILTAFSFILIMLLTTWLACRNDMMNVPSQLMRPKSPKLGKNTLLEKIEVIWKNISFNGKVTVRNLVRYKKRVLMSIVGVAGCCALLLTGFGIRDSINAMVDIQFGEIVKHDGVAKFDDEINYASVQNTKKTIDSYEDTDFTIIGSSYSSKVYVDKDYEETAYTQVFNSVEDMQKLYSIRTRQGHEDIIPSNDGVIISEKLSENLGLDIGDTLTIESYKGIRKEVKVSAIMEMYIYHYVLMTSDYYNKVFDVDMVNNALFVKAKGDSTQLQKKIVSLESINDIEFHDVALNNFKTMVKGIDAVVWILIISSMSLSFVVLGNLININVSERQREIATLKVLGFRRKEVLDYIYKENNILTFIGSIVGLPIGVFLHHYIMRQVEMEYIMFGRSVYKISYLYAIILTCIFGHLVNIVMHKKINGIEMVDSLKSVE